MRLRSVRGLPSLPSLAASKTIGQILTMNAISCMQGMKIHLLWGLWFLGFQCAQMDPHTKCNLMHFPQKIGIFYSSSQKTTARKSFPLSKQKHVFKRRFLMQVNQLYFNIKNAPHLSLWCGAPLFYLSFIFHKFCKLVLSTAKSIRFNQTTINLRAKV